MSYHHQKKVYIPTNARTNQYLMAEIRDMDSLLTDFEHIGQGYRTLAQVIFSLAEQQGIRNLQIIANDKLPVVRFHTEAYCFETAEQIRFFYNPRYHEAQNLFVSDTYRPRKLSLVFLATGTELRSHSATFHARVVHFVDSLLARLAEAKLPTDSLRIKIRDHQHMSYDLFAKAKGHKESYGYKLRAIDRRYRARECHLPDELNSLSYVTVGLPLSRALKRQLLGDGATDMAPLYQYLQDKFYTAASLKQLNRLAMVANGLTPLVRHSKCEPQEQAEPGEKSRTELQTIAFDPRENDPQLHSHWQADKLVEAAHFVIVAADRDCEDGGYGRFLNRVEEALKSFASELDMDKEREDLIVRFHQHIGYSR
jgi:hypothetical protein